MSLTEIIRREEELAERVKLERLRAKLELLRDEFATAAMNGLCASFAGGSFEKFPFQAVAVLSYQQADAMLAARERKEL